MYPQSVQLWIVPQLERKDKERSWTHVLNDAVSQCLIRSRIIGNIRSSCVPIWPRLAPSFSTYVWTQNHRIESLNIPTNDAITFCLRPYKWIRFLGFAILGVKGRLSRTGDEHGCMSDDDYEYQPTDPCQIAGCFYYICDLEGTWQIVLTSRNF